MSLKLSLQSRFLKQAEEVLWFKVGSRRRRLVRLDPAAAAPLGGRGGRGARVALCAYGADVGGEFVAGAVQVGAGWSQRQITGRPAAQNRLSGLDRAADRRTRQRSGRAFP